MFFSPGTRRRIRDRHPSRPNESPERRGAFQQPLNLPQRPLHPQHLLSQPTHPLLMDVDQLRVGPYLTVHTVVQSTLYTVETFPGIALLHSRECSSHDTTYF